MSTKNALEKLKHYYLESQGKDYLDSLRSLRLEVARTHPSSKALDEEIKRCIEVYNEYRKWTNSSYAKSKLNKKNA